MLSSIESIRNYVLLTAKIGTAGQPGADQFRFIADTGFNNVINIAMPDHPDSIDHEGRLVTELGMNYFHIPVPFDAPQAKHIRQFCDLLHSQRDQSVFVHCIMNYRVSVFMYHYLIAFEGFSRQRARSPVFDRWEIEPQWQALMDLDQEELFSDY